MYASLNALVQGSGLLNGDTVRLYTMAEKPTYKQLLERVQVAEARAKHLETELQQQRVDQVQNDDEQQQSKSQISYVDLAEQERIADNVKGQNRHVLDLLQQMRTQRCQNFTGGDFQLVAATCPVIELEASNAGKRFVYRQLQLVGEGIQHETGTPTQQELEAHIDHTLRQPRRVLRATGPLGQGISEPIWRETSGPGEERLSRDQRWAMHCEAVKAYNKVNYEFVAMSDDCDLDEKKDSATEVQLGYRATDEGKYHAFQSWLTNHCRPKRLFYSIVWIQRWFKDLQIKGWTEECKDLLTGNESDLPTGSESPSHSSWDSDQTSSSDDQNKWEGSDSEACSESDEDLYEEAMQTQLRDMLGVAHPDRNPTAIEISPEMMQILIQHEQNRYTGGHYSDARRQQQLLELCSSKFDTKIVPGGWCSMCDRFDNPTGHRRFIFQVVIPWLPEASRKKWYCLPCSFSWTILAGGSNIVVDTSKDQLGAERTALVHQDLGEIEAPEGHEVPNDDCELKQVLEAVEVAFGSLCPTNEDDDPTLDAQALQSFLANVLPGHMPKHEQDALTVDGFCREILSYVCQKPLYSLSHVLGVTELVWRGLQRVLTAKGFVTKLEEEGDELTADRFVVILKELGELPETGAVARALHRLAEQRQGEAVSVQFALAWNHLLEAEKNSAVPDMSAEDENMLRLGWVEGELPQEPTVAAVEPAMPKTYVGGLYQVTKRTFKVMYAAKGTKTKITRHSLSKMALICLDLEDHTGYGLFALMLMANEHTSVTPTAACIHEASFHVIPPFAASQNEFEVPVVTMSQTDIREWTPMTGGQHLVLETLRKEWAQRVYIKYRDSMHGDNTTQPEAKKRKVTCSICEQSGL